MDPVSVGFIAVLGGSAAIGGARKLLERRRARKALAARAPLGTETPEGTVVRVTGTVRVADMKLVAPLSAVECVVVRSRVGSMAGMAARAVRPKEWFAMVPFVLERAGEPPIAVEGEHALLDVEPQKLPRPHGPASPERARRMQLLLKLGLKPTEVARATYEEVVVTAGMRVSVAGLMMLDPAAAPPPTTAELGFRDLAPASLRIAGNAEHPLVIGELVA